MEVGGGNLVGNKVGAGTNGGNLVGVAVGGGDEGLGVVAEPGAVRSGDVGESDCSAKG